MRAASLLMSLFALSSFSLFAVADETGWTLDWSDGVVGQSPTSQISPNVRFSARTQGSNPFQIVGSEGSRINPFSHLQKALLIDRADSEKAPLVTFSLPGKLGYGKGAFEFEVFIQPSETEGKEGFRINLRTVDQSATVTSAGTFRIRPAGIVFQSAPEAESSKARVKLLTGAANTLKIEWDFEAQKGYSVSLNGKPLSVVKEGSDSTFFPISAEEAKSGVREMVIFPQSAGLFFIGKVSATAK